MKILVIALSGIGDALMFTPALKLIRDYNPEATVDALVMYKGVEDIYERTGLLDNLLYFDFLKESKVAALRFVLALRKKYSHSINVYPSNRKEYNLISFLIGAEKRATVSYLRMDFENLGFLNNVRIVENDSLHNVQENLLLVKKLINIKTDEEPGLIFRLNDEDISFAGEYLNKIQIAKDDSVIGVHPGCSTLKNHINRRWEPEKFAALASRLTSEMNAKVLFFGGPEEDELINGILSKLEVAGVFRVKTSNLAKTAAVMKRCNVFVSNDSSLMHVSAALKLKTVAIIGPTNTNYIHPWKTDYTIASLKLECSPCFHYSPKPLSCKREDIKYKCMKGLSVERVFEEVKIIL
jgi:heptosyltransferase-2